MYVCNVVGVLVELDIDMNKGNLFVSAEGRGEFFVLVGVDGNSANMCHDINHRIYKFSYTHISKYMHLITHVIHHHTYKSNNIQYHSISDIPMDD